MPGWVVVRLAALVSIAIVTVSVGAMQASARVPATAAVIETPFLLQPACDFVFGFATMRNLLGAQTVGNCVEDERFVAANGNAEQRTTNGVLVFSGLDNYMRFITDNSTWINTPTGLFERPNDRRFEWEGDRQLIENLQRGGYIIYFRHGPTDSSQRDSDPYDMADCRTQRNLTDRGRDQAATIGIHVRALQIPVGQVISTPFCRAHEYAYLIFGRVSELDATLIGPDVPLPPDVERANTEAFQRQLAAATVPAGTNLAFVGHSPAIRNALGVDLPLEGGAAILLPTSGGLPSLEARIVPDDWTALARALGRQ